MNSDTKLIEEMSKLTDTMHGLREAIKRQEHQLTNGGFEEVQLVVPSSEDHSISGETLVSSLEPRLHRTDSEISKASHWSISLDTINDSIGDLKKTLKTREKQALKLMTEHEELKNTIMKKEDELKKLTLLVKNERETFDQYRRDTSNEIRKNKSEDLIEQSNKSTADMQKLSSELAHYKTLYVEQSYTENHLAKEVNFLRDVNIWLKGKFLQQEKHSNKFVLEMTQRFDNSRKEMSLITSKQIESFSNQKMNAFKYKIAERNARLTYDNYMLKKEVKELKQQLIDSMTEENKLVLNQPYTPELFSNISGEVERLNMSKCLHRKTSSLMIESSYNHLKDKRPIVKMSALQKVPYDNSSTNVSHWDCMSKLSEGSERLERTFSDPGLNHARN